MKDYAKIIRLVEGSTVLYRLKGTEGQSSKVWAVAHLIPTKFPGHGCMDGLTTECSFDSRPTRVIDVFGLFLTCYPWLFVQPGTGRCPVNWCNLYCISDEPDCFNCFIISNISSFYRENKTLEFII